MTVSVQFPISDTSHGPYQRCIGRFETEFKPLDPDPATPGLRGGTNHCTETKAWARQPELSGIEFTFRTVLWLSCLMTTKSLWIIMFGIPEIVMYLLTFAYIKRHTNKTALSDQEEKKAEHPKLDHDLLDLACTIYYKYFLHGSHDIFLWKRPVFPIPVCHLHCVS